MKKTLVFFSSIVLSVLFFSMSAMAQEQFGEIQGTVSDPNGAVVPNASVTVSGTSIGYTRTVTTNSEGNYIVRLVPPGSYNVSVAKTGGFQASTRNNQTVTLGVSTTVNFQLTVSGGESVVNVTAELTAPVDTTENKVQTSVNSQKIELLPKGVDFTSVIKTAPGTRGEGLAGGFSVDGASGSENSFIIDGQEVSNFRTGVLNGNNAIPTQFVQEVQVKSSGFEAEFGGATGGVINVVTKGGGNDYRGEFGIQFQSKKLEGGARPSLQRFTAGTGATFTQTMEYITPPKSEGMNYFPTANLSGPIVKDKLWFYTAYSPQIFESDVTTQFFTTAPAATRAYRFSETYKAKTTYEYAFMRLDAAPMNNLRVSATYLWNPIKVQGVIPFGTVALGSSPASVNFGGSIGTLTGAQLYSQQGGRQNSNNVTAQANWTPSSNVSVTGRFSRGFLNEKSAAYMVPSEQTRFICATGAYAPPSTFANGCPSGYSDPSNSVTRFDVSKRTNIEGDMTYFFNAGGRHELKGGYQWSRILNEVNRGYIKTGVVYLYYNIDCAALAGAPYTPTAGNIGCGFMYRYGTVGKGTNTNQGVYFQDKWTIGKRLTLNLGVRMEKEDLPSFNGLAPPINFGWGDKLAPRLGFAWDLMGDGKNKVFASYGKFHDRLKFEMPRGSFGGDFYREDFFDIMPTHGPYRTFYTVASIVGNFNDAPGGSCPGGTASIGSGLSRCQYDYRIASNNPNATIFDGKVDPDMKGFQQTEYTFGFERQLNENYIFRTRYTYKNVDWAIEDAGVRNNAGSEAYIIGNPGSGLHLSLLKQLGYTKAATPERRYDGLEFTVERRLRNNYYFNTNYTYSRLYGNYSGLASSDEAGRTSPGVNRFFDLPHLGFTAAGTPDNGRLATDRPHVFNAYGAYIYNWGGSKNQESTFSFFTTAQSGTPQTSTIGFITTSIFLGRGDLGRTETFTNTDFLYTHKYKFGRDNRFTAAFDFNVLNLLDEKNITGLYTSKSAVTMSAATFGLSEVDATNAYTGGTLLSAINTYLAGNATTLNRTDGRYRMASGFQGPRTVRLGFRLLF